MGDNLSGQAGLDAIARLICDFMNWPEDGPAWDDAHKLARQVHEPAYKQGWSDRDADILERAERILPAEESSTRPHRALENGSCTGCERCARGEIEGYDDGSWVELGSSAGGAHPRGDWGWCEMVFHNADGSERRREYVAVDTLPAPAEARSESSVEADYEAGFDWKAAWYALDHDAAQLRSQVDALRRTLKVAHVLCLGTAPKQAVGEVLAATLAALAEARGSQPVEAPDIREVMAELHLLEEVCAFYANDEDAALDDGEPYGSIPTEVGLKARAARRRFQAREAALPTPPKAEAE